MTARVKRLAVLVVTWIFVTTSATAMAWWAVTFVTAEVADRRPLRPSDVVAASVRQTVPVPSWANGVEPVLASVEPSSGPPAVAVDASNPLDTATTRVSGPARVAAPAPHTAQGSTHAGLVARWSPASGTHGQTATDVTPPAAEVPVAAAQPVEPQQAPEEAVQPFVTPPAAPAVSLPPPVVQPAASVSVAPTKVQAAVVAPRVAVVGVASAAVPPEPSPLATPAPKAAVASGLALNSGAPAAPETVQTPATSTWPRDRHARIPSLHRAEAAPVATPDCPEPASIPSP